MVCELAGLYILDAPTESAKDMNPRSQTLQEHACQALQPCIGRSTAMPPLPAAMKQHAVKKACPIASAQARHQSGVATCLQIAASAL